MLLEKVPLYGRVRISAKLDQRFGEMHFEVYARKEVVTTNKCLYDALSEFGIDLDDAKGIVEDFAKMLNGEKYYTVTYKSYKKPENEINKATEKTRDGEVTSDLECGHQ